MNNEAMKQKPQNEKFCQECGETINVKSEICPKCGVRQAGMNTGTNPNGKTKMAAALLALFLGGFGAHKFYLGKVGMGILYLLFFWTLIPSLIAFIEFILFLTMTEETFSKKYGNT